MKLFIASDIPGSMHYCKKMLEAFHREGADKLVLLGDVLYHGPRNDLPKEYNPKQVIELLNNIKDKILSTRGNCDTEVDQMVLDFPVLPEYGVFFDNYVTVYICHGHNKETIEKSLPQGSYLICGHTHVPKAMDCKTYFYLNPGSVSIPKENSPHGYMVYENGVFTWKNLEGEIYNTLKAGEKNED